MQPCLLVSLEAIGLGKIQLEMPIAVLMVIASKMP